MAEHVAPVLTVPQARALLEILPAEIERLAVLRGSFEPSTYTRTLARQIAALRNAEAQIRLVLPEGTP